MSISRLIERWRRRQGGFALISTLALVVIISLLLVALMTIISQDRSATLSYTQSIKADQLALGSLQLIVGELQKEMAKDAPPDSTYPAFPVYTNVTSANIAPQGVGTNAGMPSLIKISTNAPAYSGVLSSGSLRASEVSTTTPSQNGRMISASRWQQIYLGTFPNAATAPYWIMMTRGGPTNGAGLAFGPDADKSVNNPVAANTNYIIGRVAYAIYDEGGLLNVTVSGYPSSLASAAASNPVGGKGNPVWADLSQIPGIGTAANADALVAWRNGASGSSATAYVNYATNYAAANGFGKVYPGDMTFLSRGDLIRYALANPTTLSTNALPYLTTFSCDLNAPGWGPSVDGIAGYTYKSSANDTASTNRFYPNVRVQTAFTRADGTQAKVGESLVTRRFPLSRLALLTLSATADGTSDIFKYFGLKRTDASSPWVYSRHTDGTPASSIQTLEQVATEIPAREPDFFELLYATILSGSLGTQHNTQFTEYATSAPDSNTSSADANLFFQTLRIGANIMDQYDADNFPTAISLLSGGTAFTLSGIEDLPYPNKIVLKLPTGKPANGNNSGTIPTSPSPNWYTATTAQFGFEMWNPHQLLPTRAVAGPSKFRIVTDGTGAYSVHSGALPDPSVTTLGTPTVGFIPSTTIVRFDANPTTAATALPSSYREPRVIRYQDATTTPAGDASILSFSDATVTADPAAPARALGFKIPIPKMPGPVYSVSGSTTTSINPLINASTGLPSGTLNSSLLTNKSWSYAIDLSHVMFAVQYWDDSSPTPDTALNSTHWRTYTTFAGMAETPASGIVKSGAWYIVANAWSGTGAAPSYTQTSNMGTGAAYAKSDPRTWRFGVGQARQDSWTTSPSQVDTALIPAGTSGIFFPGISNGGYINFGFPRGISRLDLMCYNQTPPNAINRYSPSIDADGVIRPGDSGLLPDPSQASNWENNTTSTMPPVKMGATATRPIILNRPFRSVGELGYVFRDTPWKTLDLFSADSADIGLLDVFSLEEQPVLTVGRVNLNTGNSTVLKALLSGVTVQEPSNTIPAGLTLSAADAASLAQAMVNASATTRLVNYGDLATRLVAAPFADISYTQNKMYHESIMRALAGATSTRTWNLLIDVVAQAGKYPPTATQLDQFVTEGERHYWLHVAIDRFTGNILEQKMETLDE